jgi:hypothetical protein
MRSRLSLFKREPRRTSTPANTVEMAVLAGGGGLLDAANPRRVLPDR